MKCLEMVKQSYGRACLNPHIIDRFYEIFLDSNPVIKPMFHKTDFSKQKQLLRTGVVMLLAHLEGKTSWTSQIDRIAESHSKKHLNIPPALYHYWIESLIAAVKECDPKWTPELEPAWQKTLQAGTDYIAQQYDKF
jgi:hemoglobin-like flavoprotein